MPTTQRSGLIDLPVLVVDDNATNRRILEEVLGNWGMKPTVVAGALEALAALDRAHHAGEAFRLIISDVNMPEIDGFGLVERVKDNALHAGMPIIFLTSESRPADADRCRALGVSARLAKPVKQSGLLDAIVVAVDRQQVRAKHPQSTDADTMGGETKRLLRVLLAEDNKINQKFAVRALAKQGHEVTLANDGAEAVEAWKNGSFDVVLMDVRMPEVDGYTATSRIRQLEEGKGIQTPIIAMTAHAMKGDRDRCIESGMDGYMTKPIDTAAMMAEIDRVLGNIASQENSRAYGEAMNEVVDKAELMERVENDLDFLADALEVYNEDCPQLISQMRDALSRQDSAALGNGAHTLKGLLSNFAAHSAVEAALKLEAIASQRELSGASQVLATLEHESKRLKDALEKILKEGERCGF
jgi:CheY-like chemotaxis protein